MKKCPDPEWYVYVENFNARETQKFNVFHSRSFHEGCIKAFKKFKDPVEIEKEIKSWAMYSFWCKAEYEIKIGGLFTKDDSEFTKISVYDQLMLNWDSFFRYVYEHKAYFLRKVK